ncbi:MAG: polyprenyl synthetase family protein [Treponema sp.]|jgi:octaprenyl-diphosphate synthase|nr:polyprenyl synthetase family protein [Treponema sp.]
MDQQYTIRLEKIEKTLERWLPENPGGVWADEVFPGLGQSIGPELLRVLAAPGRDILSRGGKRWRPLLMTLVCEALGGGDAALPLAPLVEFCHNASLIHDDIEDNSDERRGKPAVHLIHGVDAAINAGSFLYFLPLACIESWLPAARDNCRADVYALWAAHLRRLHLGQAIDIHWHRNFNIVPSVDEYLAMCALKTGCLVRFAAELGAAAAAAVLAAKTTVNAAVAAERTGPLGDTDRLINAAEKLGVGFQILDDVKNLTVGIPGKKRGDDIVEGKKSLPVLLFLQRQPEKKEMVCRCFTAARAGGVSAPETEELIQALAACGVIKDAEEQGKALIAGARAVFEENSALLAGLVDLIS